MVFSSLVHAEFRCTHIRLNFPFTNLGVDITSFSSDVSCSDGDSRLIHVAAVVELYHCQAGCHARLFPRCIIFNASYIIILKCTVLFF